LVKNGGKNKVKKEPSLKDLKGKLRKLQTEKADLLLQAKKLKRVARTRVKSMEKEMKALRRNVKCFREFLGSLNS
jgi:hypothetical protein